MFVSKQNNDKILTSNYNKNYNLQILRGYFQNTSLSNKKFSFVHQVDTAADIVHYI